MNINRRAAWKATGILLLIIGALTALVVWPLRTFAAFLALCFCCWLGAVWLSVYEEFK